jgi:hypothetical protein
LPPDPVAWWYYGFSAGQHISLFQERTLAKLGEQLGMRYCSTSMLKFLSKKPLPERALRLASGKLATILEPVARRRMRSKVMADHEHLVLNCRHDH